MPQEKSRQGHRPPKVKSFRDECRGSPPLRTERAKMGHPPASLSRAGHPANGQQIGGREDVP
jgi:hypothetical protein